MRPGTQGVLEGCLREKFIIWTCILHFTSSIGVLYLHTVCKEGEGVKGEEYHIQDEARNGTCTGRSDSQLGER